ncbi:MAG: ABC-type transport auxiliary lipoprotein family protein [Phycisphaerales bacterium]
MHVTTTNRILAQAAVAAVLALLPASCSIFDRESPQGASFMLAARDHAPQQGASLGTIVVGRYSAMPPFDGRMLLYCLPDGTWRTDPYNGFIANPTDMLCDLTARAFEQSGRFSTVVVEGAVVSVDLAAEGVIEQFYADYSDRANPAAVVRLRVYLVDRRGLRSAFVSQAIADARAPISGDGAGAVADALGAAVGMALAKLTEQLPAELPPPANPLK